MSGASKSAGATLLADFEAAIARAKFKHGCFLELFSGAGEVARSLRSLGYACLEFDIAKGPAYDLCRPSVQRFLRALLGQGHVLGVWFGTPCTSWSIACRPALRSRAAIWGLPRESLAPHRLPTLDTGNQTLLVTCGLIRACLKFKVPCMLENPASSLLFHAPPMQSLLSHEQCVQQVCTLCAYGAKWRKLTRVAAWNVASNPFSRQCSGRQGKCSFTSRHHVRLSGNAPGGIPWSRIAGAYPARFGREAAGALAGAHLEQVWLKGHFSRSPRLALSPQHVS